MTPEELRAISDEVGELHGWDFSCVKAIEDEPAWVYGEVVRRHLQPENIVLDLGSGGGEVFLGFAADLALGYGIDQSSERLQAAVQNQQAAGAGNIRFLAMDAGSLAFPDSSLDIVLGSFAGYDVAEVARVLRPGGIFITQQIGDRDTQNIFDVFGWGSYGDHWRQRYAAKGDVYLPTVQTAKDFEAAGCTVMHYEEYDVPQWYLDIGSLVFFLKASPLPWPFAPETYAAPLTLLLERYGSERGIETNAHRELLIVRR